MHAGGMLLRVDSQREAAPAMKRTLVIGWMLASGCVGWGEDGVFAEDADDDVLVCTHGDAGRCCVSQWDHCSVFDEDCDPGEPLPRLAARCQLCWPWAIDDPDMPPPVGTPPPNPPPDAGWTVVDGGVRDSRIEVCGRATYTGE
jgi:hypothetical protein